MQLDTDKNGLVVFFKPWQVPLVDELFERTLTSGQAQKFLEDHDIRTTQRGRGPVSRASAIFFMNEMVDWGLLDYSEETGRGGYHRIYKMVLTREEFAHKITGLFVSKLLEVFPTESLTFLWPRPKER